MGPSKAIVVLPEEVNECEAKFWAEACSDLDLVVQVSRMDADVVEFVYSRLVWLWKRSRGRL